MADAIQDFVRATIEREAAAAAQATEDERSKLRLEVEPARVAVSPGEVVTVALRITNPGAVIETVTVQLLGLMPERVEFRPAEVALFPGESVDVELELAFDDNLPSGEHEGLVMVSGRSGRTTAAVVPLRIDVPVAPGFALVVEPPVRTAGKKTTFDLFASNRGNTPLDLHLSAVDTNRILSIAVDRPTLRLPVGGSEAVTLRARGKRPWTGSPVEHTIDVEVASGDLTEVGQVTFRQKPRLTAGVITLLTLMFIVALWAIAMFFGVTRALEPPQPMKVVPESLVQGGVGLEDLDPGAVGGIVAGTVTATSTSAPVPRVTVEAFSRDQRLVAATATAEDGSYELTGLLPVRHHLRLRAPGFAPIWFPDSPTFDGSESLLASPTDPTTGVDVVLPGQPAAMGGQVVAGDDAGASTVSVTATPVDLLEPAGPFTTVADGAGGWAISGLPAPATYRIVYSAAGYADVEIVQPLDAGEQFVVNTTSMPAAGGTLGGVVRDAVTQQPLGGVEIVAQAGDATADFTTPTTGRIGVFTFEDLETPGTFLLTFTAEGFAPQTRAVTLGPGEVNTELTVDLAPAAGRLSGTVTALENGTPLGGVVVTVRGNGVVLQATSLTSGDVGTYQVSGLPVPGTYTVTFDGEGRQRESVRVRLRDRASGGPDFSVDRDVALKAALGAIEGRVVDEDGGVGAVEVEVSDGEAQRTTTTASAPASRQGSFRIAALEPGSYTITARLADGSSVTALVDVAPGEVTQQDIDVSGES